MEEQPHCSSTRDDATERGGLIPERKETSFNLRPEVIPGSEEPEEELRMEDLTEAQMLELKERSQKRVKRIVAAVGITLTVISIVLVALSLSLGPKIDSLGLSCDPLGKPYDVCFQ